jgi:hypothetical protein
MGSAPLVLDSRDVDDRAVDLWAPLPALAMVADVEAGGDRAERLLRAAREADDESGQAARLVGALERSGSDTPAPNAAAGDCRSRR